MYGIIDPSLKQRRSILTPSGFINARAILSFLITLANKVIEVVITSGVAICQTIWPQQEKCIKGQIVLITRAGTGIGRELAKQFADEGCIVVCVDRDTTSNEETVAQINRVTKDGRNQFRRAYAYTCEVTDHCNVFQLAKEVEKELGRVDILINNTTITSLSQTEPRQTSVICGIKDNMLSHFWTVLAFLPGMVLRKQGHIVSVITETSLAEATENMRYSSSQYAVRELMDSLYKELSLKEKKNIKFTCVHPFFIETKPSEVGKGFDIRLPCLSLEFAATEIIKGIRLNLESFTIPRNLLVWINVLRCFQPRSTNFQPTSTSPR